MILMAHVIQAALAEGAATFHFLRGREGYKYSWGAVDRWNQRLTFVRGSSREARPDLRAWLAASPAHTAAGPGGLCGAEHCRRTLPSCASPSRRRSLRTGDRPGRAACEGAGRHPRTRRGAERLRQALALWHDNPQAFALVKAVLDGIRARRGGAGFRGRARALGAAPSTAWRRSAPEGSVALYALAIRASSRPRRTRSSRAWANGACSDPDDGPWISVAASAASSTPWRRISTR